MCSGRDLFYLCVVYVGKVIVFFLMFNVDYKYVQMSFKSLMLGGEDYLLFWFDQIVNFIWWLVLDCDDLIKVGNQVILFQEGLFGFIQIVDVGKSCYGVYIVDFGKYELVGFIYQLLYIILLLLSLKYWMENLFFGLVIFVIICNVEFYDSQVWFDVRYQNVIVDDGLYCIVIWMFGLMQGCVNW